ncbi:DUF4142 domain-containing protein [Agrobacterium sp. AGB01]|uniref:DUF4142 domain-containing protein n=1 Tax=Agrobacterium sp. AGB01 TaxID=2769302 RepID=UPI001781D003|nr:DUF4142 domain-containing protein [Agrobacterium sp. AGB01]MBD9388455.1 DUF4142 domain-containing protein [Agrobacterium sp. AGB01]
MKSSLHMLAISMMLVAPPLMAQEMKPKPAGDAVPMMIIDRPSFVKMTSSSNEFEILSSKLVGQKTNNERIKQIADMIIADHTKAGKKLEETLAEKDAAPPSPIQLLPKHKKMLDQLQSAEGKDFEVLYVDVQTQAHMEAVALFRTYAGSGEDQSLVGFAKETLPRLETHLAHVIMLIDEL